MKRGKKVLLGILIGILILLAAAALLLRALTGRSNYRRDEDVLRVEESETERAVRAADVYHCEEVTLAAPRQREGVYTLLVIGGDGPEQEESAERSDAQAVILMTINHNRGMCYFASLHTQLYVEIPGSGGGALGHAYALGGGPLLSETIEKNYGIAVDNYASISLKDVAGVIGMPEFETLDVSRDGLEVVEELVYRLNAVKPTQVASYISELLPYVTHNITGEQMMRIILQVPAIVGYYSEKEMLPYPGTYQTLEGYLVPDALSTSQRLKQAVYGENMEETEQEKT